MTRIKIAAAQLPHVNYDVAGNIQRSVQAVQEAASMGAKLVLLPELSSTGYIFHTELWEMAEVLETGPTVTALKQVAMSCDISVGCTILEARGNETNGCFDFFNNILVKCIL